MMRLLSGQAALLLCFAAHAQTVSPPQGPGLEKAAENAASFGSATLGRVAAPEQTPAHALQIFASQDQSAASIKLQLGPATTAGSTSLIVKVPANKDDAPTTVWSPDGTPTGTNIELRHQRWHIKGARDIDLEGNRKCVDLIKATVPAAKQPGSPSCDLKLLKEYGTPEAYRAIRDLYYDPSAAAISYGGGIGLNYDDFTYYDRITLAKHKDRHRGAGANVFLAYHPLNSQQMFSGRFEVQRTHEAADAIITCLPGGSPTLSCVQGALAPPERILSRQLSLEFRTHLSKRFALSVQYAHDLTTNVNTLQVPLYLVSNEKNALTGGLAVSYASDERKPQLSVFVTQAFSLWD